MKAKKYLKLKKYADVWDRIKNEIKPINGDKENNYGKYYMKIKFNSDNDLPLNKPLKFHAITIINRSVFEEGGKRSTSFLDDTLYKLQKCCNTKKLVSQKELTLIKQVHQTNVCFVIIGILKMLDLNSNCMFAINVSHVILMTAYELKNISILNVKRVAFRCILWGISTDEAVDRLNNSVLEDKGVL